MSWPARRRCRSRAASAGRPACSDRTAATFSQPLGRSSCTPPARAWSPGDATAAAAMQSVASRAAATASDVPLVFISPARMVRAVEEKGRLFARRRTHVVSAPNACSQRCFRLGPDLAQRLPRRQRLGIDDEVEHGRPAGGERTVERARDRVGSLDTLGVAVERLREGREVRVDEVGATTTRRGTGAPGACGSCRTCRCPRRARRSRSRLRGGGELLADIRKSPSPARQTTSRSGWTSLAAIAAGTP